MKKKLGVGGGPAGGSLLNPDGTMGPQSGGAGDPLTNTAPENPRLSGFMDNYGSRLKQLQERPTSDPNREFLVGKLKERMSADTTQRAIGKAQGEIRDQGEGARKEMVDLAARGGEAVPFNVASRMSADTQRRQAGAAADITLGRERDLDALTLGGSRIMESPGDYAASRENELSAFTLGGLPGANALASQQLAQQNFGLNMWQAQNQDAYQDAQLEAQLTGQTAALNKLKLPKSGTGKAGLGLSYS